MNTVEVIDRGMKCLSDNLGESETELFITTLLKERFDYTTWRKTMVDGIKTFDDLDAFVGKTSSNESFSGNAKVIL